MPDQEFPRPSARSYRPDRDDEDPPPWANLPPVRPTRPRHLAGAANPPGPGRPATAGARAVPADPGFRTAGPLALAAPAVLVVPAALGSVLRVPAASGAWARRPVALVALGPVLRVRAAASAVLAAQVVMTG